VYFDVAHGARLVLRRLVVGRPLRLCGCEVHRWRMALQADRVHIGAIEQPGIRAAVREVARRAAFGLDDRVLIHKRTGCLVVALRADRILLRRGPQSLSSEGSVRVMTVGAAHRPFLDPMVVGHRELGLDVGVALVTKYRLRSLEQLLAVLGGVNAVAADAAHIGFAMAGFLEIGVLAAVAFQAVVINLFGCRLGGVEDLTRVGAVRMRLARPMAVLTGDPVLAVHLGHLGVRIRREPLGYFLVARCASFRACKLRRGRVLGLGLSRRLRTGPGSCYGNGAKHDCAQDEHQTASQPRSHSSNRATCRFNLWPTRMHENTSYPLSARRLS